jgi:hypothetical protein
MFKTLLLLLAAAPFVAAQSYTGEGTAYCGPNDKDCTGLNACGFGNIGPYFEVYYGAMNWAQFPGRCGQCVLVHGTEAGASGAKILVKIIDMCPGCSYGDIDFSTKGLLDITGFSWDRKDISWEWVPDCNIPSPPVVEQIPAPVPTPVPTPTKPAKVSRKKRRERKRRRQAKLEKEMKSAERKDTKKKKNRPKGRKN